MPVIFFYFISLTTFHPNRRPTARIREFISRGLRTVLYKNPITGNPDTVSCDVRYPSLSMSHHVDCAHFFFPVANRVIKSKLPSFKRIPRAHLFFRRISCLSIIRIARAMHSPRAILISKRRDFYILSPARENTYRKRDTSERK